MKQIKNCGIGVISGIVGSAVVAVFASLLVGHMRHPLESFPWLFLTSAVPAGLMGVVLGRLRRLNWLTSAAIGFAVVAIAGSAGAIIVQGLRFGFDTVNSSGYVVWCWAYAAALVPVSAPLVHSTSRLVSRSK